MKSSLVKPTHQFVRFIHTQLSQCLSANLVLPCAFYDSQQSTCFPNRPRHWKMLCILLYRSPQNTLWVISREIPPLVRGILTLL